LGLKICFDTTFKKHTTHLICKLDQKWRASESRCHDLSNGKLFSCLSQTEEVGRGKKQCCENRTKLRKPTKVTILMLALRSDS